MVIKEAEGIWESSELSNSKSRSSEVLEGVDKEKESSENVVSTHVWNVRNIKLSKEKKRRN